MAERDEAADDPEHDALRRAERAFERGDWAEVRRLCDGLGAASPEVARQARQLRRRVGVDRVQLAVVLACLAIFLVIVYVYVT